MKFSEMAYRRPEVPALLRELADWTEEAGRAESGPALVKVYEGADRVLEEYSTLRELASIRYTIDTRDPFYSGEHDYLMNRNRRWKTRPSPLQKQFYPTHTGRL